MKNKTSLVLMEQLIMVLVFALAAALCLQVFVEADRISQETACRDEAVLMAQNAAEILKATSGDADRAMLALPADAAAAGYRMELERQSAGTPLMGMTEIRVYLKEKLLFTLHTGWQEDGA